MIPQITGIALVFTFQIDNLSWPKVHPAFMMSVQETCLQINVFREMNGLPNLEDCGD